MSEKIPIPCPNCQRELRLKPDLLGQIVVCKYCDHQFRARDYVHLPCPNCHARLEVRREYLGLSIDCRYCQQTFTAQEPAPFSKEESNQAVELAALREKLKSYAELEAALEAAKNELVGLRAKRQHDKQLGRQTEAERDQLQGQLTALQAELANLSSQVASAEARARAHSLEQESQRKTWEAALDAERAARAEAAEAWAALTERAAAHEQELAALRIEFERERASLQTELDAAIARETRSRLLADELQTRLEQAIDDQLSLGAPANAEELEAARAEIASLRRQLAAAERTHQALRGQLRSLGITVP